MNGKEIIDALRKKHGLGELSDVGVVSTFGQKTKIDQDGRTIEIVATTDDIDLDEEVVLPGGADRTYFEKNGQIFHDHKYQMENAVAALRVVQPFSMVGKHTGFKIRAFMYPGNPIADTILTIAEHANIGASIGFEALAHGKPTDLEIRTYSKNGRVPQYMIRKWRWLETSFTPFPCNVSCQTQKAFVNDSKMALLDELLTKGRITREGAEAFGLVTKSVPKIPVIVRAA